MYGMVQKSELQEMMAVENLEEAADRMLRAALDAGGRDNISLVLLQDNTAFEDEEADNGNAGLDSEGGASEEVTPQ
jgi:serine/threonine protein phosphatase PrpC